MTNRSPEVNRYHRLRRSSEMHYRIPLERLHICFQDANLAWYPSEVHSVKQMIKKGMSIYDMADELRRPEIEIEILLLEINRNKKKGNRA